MANHWTIAALVAFGVAFLLIAIGGVAYLLVPFIIWETKGFGSLDRAIKCRMKASTKILNDPALTYDDWRAWQHDTWLILSGRLGEWHPEVRGFESSGAYNAPEQSYYRNAGPELRKTLVIQQLHSLSETRRILREGHESIIILDSKIKLS